MIEVTGTIKRFFPVILKPVALVLLFFIAVAWIYHVNFAILDVNMGTTPDFTPEVRARELGRVNSFGSFLINMFMGNFGVSFMTLRPVSEELFWRLQWTLLLIGLSTILSMLTGVGLAAILSVIFRPSRRKPSTFAHSLKGFLFGVTPLVALLFMLFFIYYLRIFFGLQLFPIRGIFSIPPPTDSLAYMVDVAWHLVLPVSVLVLVNAVRALLTIWSSGSSFTSNSLLKRLLLPVTTIDFTLTISAVIFVEWVFSLPGIGRWFLNSLIVTDYPVVTASFVAFVAIAVGLGFVSVLFDLIQRFVGLRDDLDKKIVTQSKININQTGDFRNCVKLFLRRRGLVIGSAIVIAFLVLAVFAPFMTPYDPKVRKRVAQNFAMPAWVTLFPQYGNLSTTKENSLYWSVEEGQEFIKGWGENVIVHYETDGIETVDVRLTAKFSHLSIPPNNFYLDFAWKSEDVQDVTYSLKLTLSTPEGDDYELWVQQPLDTNKDEVVSIESTDPHLKQRLGFQMQDNIANKIFSEKNEYTTLLEIRLRSRSEYAKCKISFEDAEFVVLGHVHGILGTDNAGLDVFTSLVYGARTMLIFAFPIAFLALILGLPFGFFSGYFQGWADNVAMPLIDSLLSLPVLPTFMVVICLFGRSWNIFLLTSLLFLPALAAKAFRNKFLVRPSNQKFVGKTTAKQTVNVLKDLFANFCLVSISLVLLLSSIDFLGFGDQRVPSWGKMLQDSFSFGGFRRMAWWWILPPAVCITLFSLGLLLVGAGFEDEAS